MIKESNVNETRKRLYDLLEGRVGKEYLENVYLTSRSTLVPTSMEDEVLQGVQRIFLNLFESISELADEALTKGLNDPKIKVIVQPSYDSSSYIAIISEKKERVLFRVQEEIYKFTFDSKEALIDYMLEVFQYICLSYVDITCDERFLRNSLSKKRGA